jgi:hypothetical protein
VIVLVNHEVLIGSAAGTERRLCPSCDLARLRGSPLSPVQSDALTRGIFDWSKQLSATAAFARYPRKQTRSSPFRKTAIEGASHMKAIQYRAFGSHEQNKFVDLPAANA